MYLCRPDSCLLCWAGQPGANQVWNVVSPGWFSFGVFFWLWLPVGERTLGALLFKVRYRWGFHTSWVADSFTSNLFYLRNSSCLKCAQAECEHIFPSGMCAFLTAIEKNTVTRWVCIIASSSEPVGEDKSCVFLPAYNCAWILSMVKISRKHEKNKVKRSEFRKRKVVFTHLSAKCSVKSENSPHKPKRLWRC